ELVPARLPAEVGLPHQPQKKLSVRPLLTSLIIFLMLLLVVSTVVLTFNIHKLATLSSKSVIVTTGLSLTPTSSPSPTPSLPVATSPAIAGNYSGNVHNSLEDLNATIRLTINQDQSQINGQFTVSPPLAGSGPLTGKVYTDSTLQFT